MDKNRLSDNTNNEHKNHSIIIQESAVFRLLTIIKLLCPPLYCSRMSNPPGFYIYTHTEDKLDIGVRVEKTNDSNDWKTNTFSICFQFTCFYTI